MPHVPIIPHAEYTPSQIVYYGWIGKAENKQESDYRYVLRLIKYGKLQARNVCLTGQKYFRVRGEDILRYRDAS
jgi:hypothetical protein